MVRLTDSEIMEWDKRLENLNYRISPMNSKHSSKFNIALFKRSNYTYHPHHPHQQLEPLKIDPPVVFNFSFSVSKNRNLDFLNLLDRMKKFEFENLFILNATDSYVKEIKASSEIDINITEHSHIINNRDFIRYEYKFNGTLSSIISYVTYIDYTISFFEKKWGYDKDGNEYNLIKYPIGSVVSTLNEKTKDYLVFDYNYKKNHNNGEYIIDYIISEMLIQESSPIIRYGKIEIYTENLLCYNRDSRINNILN